MEASEYAYLQAQEIIKETAKAMFIKFKSLPNGLWVPTSLIADNEDYKAGDKDFEIAIKRWWCEKEGLA